jgi:hypothetical protein
MTDWTLSILVISTAPAMALAIIVLPDQYLATCWW